MNSLYPRDDSRYQFQSFKEQFPEWRTTFDVYDRDSDEVYQRIKCVWNDSEMKHEYHATFNTRSGDIYLDCPRKKIFAKHLTFIFLRPIHITIKTIWHATIVGPAALEIYKTAKGKQTALEGLKNFGISMLDIGLTPLLGVAMTITSIASVILSPFNPNILYRGRDIVSTLEKFMHHTTNLTKAKIPSLSPCFSPIANIATIHSSWAGIAKCDEKSVKTGLTQLARANVKFRMDNRALFNNCWRLHPKDQAYVSAVAS